MYLTSALMWASSAALVSARRETFHRYGQFKSFFATRGSLALVYTNRYVCFDGQIKLLIHRGAHWACPRSVCPRQQQCGPQCVPAMDREDSRRGAGLESRFQIRRSGQRFTAFRLRSKTASMSRVFPTTCGSRFYARETRRCKSGLNGGRTASPGRRRDHGQNDLHQLRLTALRVRTQNMATACSPVIPYSYRRLFERERRQVCKRAPRGRHRHRYWRLIRVPAALCGLAGYRSDPRPWRRGRCGREVASGRLL